MLNRNTFNRCRCHSYSQLLHQRLVRLWLSHSVKQILSGKVIFLCQLGNSPYFMKPDGSLFFNWDLFFLMFTNKTQIESKADNVNYFSNCNKKTTYFYSKFGSIIRHWELKFYIFIIYNFVNLKWFWPCIIVIMWK